MIRAQQELEISLLHLAIILDHMNSELLGDGGLRQPPCPYCGHQAEGCYEATAHVLESHQ